MIGPKAKATDGSVAVTGDNNGNIFNLTVREGGQFVYDGSVKGERTLGTYLGKIIAVVAQQTLSEYGHRIQRNISNEVQDKLTFNFIGLNDRFVKTYLKYFFILDRAYRGVEQSNDDARVLVRLRAGSIYQSALTKACTRDRVPGFGRVEYSRQHSHALIEEVKQQLAADYIDSAGSEVDPAWVDLAVSLLVADAVADCEVLERNPNVTST